jgi:hypothetical protein
LRQKATWVTSCIMSALCQTRPFEHLRRWPASPPTADISGRRQFGWDPIVKCAQSFCAWPNRHIRLDTRNAVLGIQDPILQWRRLHRRQTFGSKPIGKPLPASKHSKSWNTDP